MINARDKGYGNKVLPGIFIPLIVTLFFTVFLLPMPSAAEADLSIGNYVLESKTKDTFIIADRSQSFNEDDFSWDYSNSYNIDFKMPTNVVSSGGAPMASDNYKANGTVGQPSALSDEPPTQSSGFKQYPGFWYTINGN